jgi:predicted metal-binding membrane protein
MLMLVALSVMSVIWMGVIAVLVITQKLLPFVPSANPQGSPCLE